MVIVSVWFLKEIEPVELELDVHKNILLLYPNICIGLFDGVAISFK